MEPHEDLEKRLLAALKTPRTVPLSEGEAIRLDIEAKEATHPRQELVKRALAGIWFFNYERYFEAGMSFDRAASAAGKLRQLKTKYYLSALCAQAYQQADNPLDAGYASLRAAECCYYLNNSSKAKAYLTEAEQHFRNAEMDIHELKPAFQGIIQKILSEEK